ncbi:ectonucleotide pyrophosphatase/phosphodiesterase family member 5 [Elysia marginata]|uniref:Ectonucleotide pyrophosphatase/phosphodiesterase family member 5 n=1 Tax=Elysia marginata TaxID=1093978 RepID=A0AAV4IQ80_9GAST|nr:ectonucleotide pyrophosphatase/phosphodiesterase family member 5 [Elysia marginata]
MAASLIINFQAVDARNVKARPLLLISFDGFRWDYLTRAKLPNIERIIREGVHATDGVKNVVDTSTLPNHWTLVTGLYPESHGIIGNFLRDDKIDKVFVPKYINADYDNDPRYYDDGGEPIWVTNQLQGGRTGSIMWWGSENAVKWSRPTLQMPYDDNVNFTRRVDVMIEWLSQEYPVNLGLIYFFEPDHIGHTTGPDSVNVTEAIKYTDVIVGYLFDRLKEKNMLNSINVIITSDHGMTTTSEHTLIFLDDYINIEDYDILSHDTVIAHIFPHKGKLDKVFSALEKASKEPNSHFRVYLAKDIPERFHMKNNHRVPPIVAFTDIHYRFVANASRGDHFPLAGIHGYDNEEKDMRPFFIATGPDFKKNYTVSSFDSVDVYPLMCQLLGIKPAPNNGSLNIVSTLLKHHEDDTAATLYTYIFVIIVANVVAGVFAVAVFRQHRYLKKRNTWMKLTPIDTKKRVRSTRPKDIAAAGVHLMAEDKDHVSDEDEIDDMNDKNRNK